MWEKFQCWIGNHRWKTHIGDKDWVDAQYPVCINCGATYYLNWKQVNEVHSIQNQIRDLKQRLSDIQNQIRDLK